MVKVRDGQIVDESSTLIHPPVGFDHFDGFNIWLHGINAEMVVGAPSWCTTLEWIIWYVGSDPLVCHNAGFDMGVVRYACIADDLQLPSVDFLCTMVLARRAYRLPSYRLPFVAAECDVDLGQHHQAVSDARCAALIAVAMARKQGAQTLAELADFFNVRIGHMETGYYSGSVRRSPGGHGLIRAIGHMETGYYSGSVQRSPGGHGLIRADANPDADPDHSFYRRVIVFTGALMSRTRQMAWDDVIKVGGIPESSVTKRTNILVIGDINPAVLVPGMTTTGKAAKAFALQDKGQEIEVMTEDDFLSSL